MDSVKASKVNYGIDAPIVICVLLCAGVLAPFLGLFLSSVLKNSYPLLSLVIKGQFLLTGVVLLIESASMVNSSKRGKKKYLIKAIAKLQLNGDEKVLDVGCGRGLFSIEIAKKLSSGKVTGIDIWQAKDQSGNSLSSALENICSEGVENRVEFKTANMCAIPFPDHSFDVLTSSLALHNVPSKEGRATALAEMARVLKPSGRLILIDFRNSSEYLSVLSQLGWSDVTLSKRTFQIFPPVRAITAQKPC